MNPEPVVVGGTYEWYATIYKNIVTAPGIYPVWDLTGATIMLTFVSPLLVKTQYTATIDVAANGTVYYTNPAGLFTAAGFWSRSWKISQSGIILESKARTFEVFASMAAV